MKETIRSLLDNPAELEKLYRSNKPAFERDFRILYPEIKGNSFSEFWKERLNYESEEIRWGTGKEIFFVLIAALLAGLIAKIPAIFSLDEEFFYPRNIGFIFLPLLTAYFIRKNRVSGKQLILTIAGLLLSIVYINMLPASEQSDTLILACIYLPVTLWSLLGISFAGNYRDTYKRLDFLKYNGDLIVMTTLILIAGGIMTGITIGLFSLIGISIEDFYVEYIGVMGLAAAPIIGSYLTRTNPQLVNKVSPVIAKIFSPLVLITLVIYLITILYIGKDPYNDRDFLILFNLLLAGVMAILFFSLTENYKSTSKTNTWVLFLLSVITILISSIAASAIIFRIIEWGITPNRLAVLGTNVLMLINLIYISLLLFRTLRKKTEGINIGKPIADFLPGYTIWAMIVVYLFPMIFGFN